MSILGTNKRRKEISFSEAAMVKAICRESLYDYVKEAWKYVESFPFVDNWHIKAICEHLQAVTRGEIKKLLINIPPGCSKPIYECSLVYEKTKGKIELKDIEVGDEILTHKCRYRKVLAVHEQGELPLVRVETSYLGRKVLSALDHPFITTEGLVEARYLKGRIIYDIYPPSEGIDKITINDLVKDVVSQGFGKCRCLTVEEDSSFVANNIAVHNSLITCVFWPTWEWTIDPSVKWFFASYDQRLSTRDSVKCRNLINNEWYQKLWGDLFKLHLDQNQKIYYETTKGGYRMATSVSGHGTGEHPGRLVYDDPHNVKEAESDIERQNVIDWHSGTMSTRGVAIDSRRVIIMQRLHWEDLSNYVLDHEEGWDTLILPMRFEKGRMKTTSIGWNDPRTEEGELLTPNLFDEHKVRMMEKTLGPYGTAGQLQQSPSPKEGGMFKIHYFNRRVKAAPMNSRRVRFIDRASTSGAGCYTACVLMAKDSNGIFYIEHVHKGQWEPIERNNNLKAIALRDRAKYGPNHEPVIWIEKEGGSSGKDAFQGIVRHLAGFTVREHAVSRLGDKEMRADPLSAMMAAENVFLVEDGSWDINSFVEEMCHFPNSKFKDQVDAASGAFAVLANAKKAGTLLIYNRTSQKKKGHLRILVLSREQLSNYVVEEDSILISIVDHPPYYNELRPDNALVKNRDYVQLVFSDLEPVDYQDRWDDIIEPYNLTPDRLIMNRENGRDLWKTILKKRDGKIDVLVFQDEGDRRAISMAKCVCDLMRLDRKDCIYYGSYPDSKNEGEAENKHVYSMTKMTRSLVI